MESMQRTGDDVIEILERSKAGNSRCWSKTGKPSRLFLGLSPKRVQEESLIEPRESTIDPPGRAAEVERDRNSGSSLELKRQVIASFAEELEQDISAKGNTGESKRRTRELVRDSLEHEGGVGRFTGVVESRSAIHL
jgi:TFIIF-interacting CTD phosphatase-like protein